MQPVSTPNLTTEKVDEPVADTQNCTNLSSTTQFLERISGSSTWNPLPTQFFTRMETLFCKGSDEDTDTRTDDERKTRKRAARWAKGQGRRKLCQRAYVYMEILGELSFPTKQATELSHRHGSARPVCPPAFLSVERVIFQSSVYSRTVSAILS